ncbi:MAG TPA: hypothetical protein VGF67_33230 [Ktedonobacteraceae bacterium]
MSEEERRQRLIEAIELGEELFEKALAIREMQAGGDAAEPVEATDGETVDLRAAAETFFRVLRKLANVEREGW